MFSASSQRGVAILIGMELNPLAHRRVRYLVPLGVAAATAVAVLVPQVASGAQHPNLPAKTAAQLLASLEQATLPQFTGTVVETARLGLPDLSDSSLGSEVTPKGNPGVAQLVTLLTGSHTAQIAYGGPDKQRVAIFLSNLSETDIVHNGQNLWTYSSDSNSVTHSVLSPGDTHADKPDATTPLDPTRAAEQALAQIDPSTRVRVDRTAQVAGRPAYQIDLAPRDARTLVSSVRIALDATTSMPLRVQVWSRTDRKSPAFSVGFTSVSMSAPSDSTFDFTSPPNATTGSTPFSGEGLGGAPAGTSHTALGSQTIGKDWTAVYVDKLADTGGPSLSRQLDKLGTPVASGRVITTSLLTILVTNDNRVLVGAVTPQYLEQVAASKAAQ